MSGNHRIILSIVFFVFAPALVYGQQTGIGITALGEYSYNTTYGHHGNLDLMAEIPYKGVFEFQPALQLSTANTYTAALQTRALFALPAGSLYLKNRILFKDVARSGMYDACLGLSLGYDWDYLDVEFGMFGRFMDSFDRDWHTLDGTICEPFNLLYSITGRIRPADSSWNIYLALSNTDIFQLERMWQPIFHLGGWLNLSDRLRLGCELISKPTGMFHLNAEFYSITARAGITYYL